MTPKHRNSEAKPSWRARGQAWLGPLLLLSFSCVIAVLFAELVVRLVRPQTVWRTTPPGLYAPDGDEGYKLAPSFRGRSYNRTEFDNLVSVNQLGVRGAEMGAKRDGVKRILVLGDSFAFGVGVEDDETFAALLPAMVAKQEHAMGAPTAIETINSGIPGLGAPQQVRWLERHGLAMEPDAIVLAVFLGNDLQDATAEAVSWRIVDGQMVGRGSTPKWRHWLYFNSHLYALLKSAVPSGLQQRVRQRLGLAEPTSDRLGHGVLAVYAKPQSEVSRDGAAGTAKALDRLMTIARERGMPVAAMLIPELAQVSPERWQSVFAQLDADPADYDVLAPNHVFGQLLAERGIPVLDLTDGLSAAIERGEQPYFERDRHWTAPGHVIAADELASFLAERGWFE